ncbi:MULTISPECIES: type II secretion system F family protein [Ferrimonas]|uniref:type II secretion system F family protein n=1 Tax=Ferrimonas TaxID=44011 RepID=UPI00041ADFCC|nr:MULTISPECIES: type II secretion system F family protein [Ferrimonas]USD38805.1 type II secretion system F family protein [Ferrimonas sp. SCSIO 43195]
MSLYIACLLGGLALLLYGKTRPDPKAAFLKPEQQVQEKTPLAVNLKNLGKSRLYLKLKELADPALDLLGDGAWIKIGAFLTLVFSGATFANQKWLQLHPLLLPALITLAAFIWGWSFMLRRRKTKFEETFPDALNIMMSAVTAGDSVTQSITYVGKTLDNTIGREFKHVGERLKLGEPPESVFKRSCKRFPYPAYLFFVVTIRANMTRGGQLKNVMARLIRVLVDSRAMEKKKMALTSEARLSAKIVAALPLAFMGIMHLMNPDDLQFVLFHPDGRWILFYVLGSEALGLTIIWLLVRGVR